MSNEEVAELQEFILKEIKRRTKNGTLPKQRVIACCLHYAFAPKPRIETAEAQREPVELLQVLEIMRG